MNPDDLLDMAGDPRFIPGIYNYCDRWCDRCGFTDRCLNYASSLRRGRKFEQDFDSDDVFDSDAFFEELAGIFQETIDLIRHMAEEEGIDLIRHMAEEEGIDLDTDSPAVEKMMVRDEEVRQQAEEHPLTAAANRYVGLVNDWFVFGQRPLARDRDVRAEACLPAGADLAPLVDALEIIRWFQFMISVKIRRALGSRAREADEAEFWEEMPKDSDGTAKVALIAIDRSLGAWGALLPAFPARQAATLEMLALLSRLRIELEQEFPDAWAFVRPGFDER